MTVMLYLKLLMKEMKYRLGLLVVSALAFAVMFYINGYVMVRASICICSLRSRLAR